MCEEHAEELTSTWNRTMSSWLLAMKLLSRTPRLNQLPRQRNTLMNIFSSLPVFSTHDVYERARVRRRLAAAKRPSPDKPRPPGRSSSTSAPLRGAEGAHTQEELLTSSVTTVLE